MTLTLISWYKVTADRQRKTIFYFNMRMTVDLCMTYNMLMSVLMTLTLEMFVRLVLFAFVVITKFVVCSQWSCLLWKRLPVVKFVVGLHWGWSCVHLPMVKFVTIFLQMFSQWSSLLCKCSPKEWSNLLVVLQVLSVLPVVKFFVFSS